MYLDRQCQFEFPDATRFVRFGIGAYLECPLLPDSTSTVAGAMATSRHLNASTELT